MPTPRDSQLTPPGGWRSPGRVRLAPLDPKEANACMRAGVSAEDIRKIPQGGAGFADEPRMQAVMNACDEFHRERMISEPTWRVLEKHYSTRHLLELVMLIGHYEMLAGVLNSTGLPLDKHLEAGLAAAPIHGRS